MVQFIGKNVTAALPQRDDGLGKIFTSLAAPLMDTLQNDIRRVQLTAAEAEMAQKARQRAALESLAGQFRGGDLNPNMAAADAVLAGYDPKNLAAGNLFVTGMKYGAGSQQADNAAFAGGAPFGQTAMGTREGFANQQRIQQMQEATKLRVADNALVQTIGADGRPTYVRQADAVNARPVLGLNEEKGVTAANLQAQPSGLAGANPAQRAFVGAEERERTPYMAVDGTGQSRPVFATSQGLVDTQTGQPLVNPSAVGRLEGGNTDAFKPADAVERQIYERKFATAQVAANIDDLIGSLGAPDAGAAVGWAGSAATAFNNLRAQFESTVGVLSGTGFNEEATATAPALDGAVRTLFGDAGFNARAQKLGIDAAVVRSQIQNLAYAIAKANDPGGRMSDRDVVAAMQEIGGSLGDPVAMQQVLMRVKERALRSQKLYEDTYAPLVRNRAGGAPAPTAPAPQAAPQVQSIIQKYGLE